MHMRYKHTHKIITQYTKYQLQLASVHIGKATQWGERNVVARELALLIFLVVVTLI
jgi:hypothetical protein